MKSTTTILLSILASGTVANAKVPLNEIEFLRKQTVVVRVALDDPQSTTIKNCKMKIDAGALGGKLELAKDNFSKAWAKTTISTEDLHVLDAKAQACATRVSCSAYETFVASAKVDPAITQEIELVKAALDKNSATLTAKNYLSAWKGIPKPCTLLKQVLK